jgi:hypothetical protein
VASEVTIRGALLFSDGLAAPKLLELLGVAYTPATVLSTGVFEQSVPTSAVALFLGSVTSPGLYCVVNRDPTNFVTLLTSFSGTPIGEIPPGGLIIGKFPLTVSAPALIADTAAVLVEGIVVNR